MSEDDRPMREDVRHVTDDPRLERLFSDTLAASAPTHAPDRLRAEVTTALSQRRPRPRWLAMIKEPPMRISSGVAVGSPSARLAALVAATLLFAALATGAVVAGASLLDEREPIVVAADGSGDYRTVTEAVVAAQDGETILVKPGTYQGSIVVGKDIVIRGDGAPDEVVIEIPPDAPNVDAGGYGVRLVDTTATVESLTIRSAVPVDALQVIGGAPTLEDLEIVIRPGLDRPRQPCCLAFSYSDGAAGTMRDVATPWGGTIESGSSPTIERLVLIDTPGPTLRQGWWGGGCCVLVLRIAGPGSDPVIADSRIEDIEILDQARPTIDDSRIDRYLLIRDGAEPTITDSDLARVVIRSTGTPVIRDSTIDDPSSARGDIPRTVLVDIDDSSPLLEGNRLRDHAIGVRVAGGAPTLLGNSIERTETGVLVLRDDGMTLAGSTFCDNEEDLRVAEGSAITLDGNEVSEVCE
jgi:hypothetical protein